MKNLSLDQILAILNSGDFDQLKGAIEDETLECKLTPYQIEHDHQKHELAKDVCALANAKGGIIIIGVRAEKDLVHPIGDIITTINPMERALVNPDAYMDVLNKWLYPRPENVQIRWFDSLSHTGKGIPIILVPSQSKAKWPFLITKTPDDRGKNRTILFGFSERRISSAEPASIEEVHRLIRDGGLYGSLNEKLEAVHEAVQDLKAGHPETRVPSPTELLDARVGLVLSELDLGPSSPTYALTVCPIATVEIQTLFESRDAPIVKLLDHPPELREGGFDLDTGENARIVAGERRRAITKKYKALNLWRDGTLIYAAEGEYLCWGMPSGTGLIINQLSLIESIYLFVNLSHEVYVHSTPKPKKLLYQVRIRNMTVNEVTPGLMPGVLQKLVFASDAVRAPDDAKVIELTWHEEEIRVGEIAFKLASEFYAWFGLDQDKIPYSEKAGGIRIISDAELRRRSAF